MPFSRKMRLLKRFFSGLTVLPGLFGDRLSDFVVLVGGKAAGLKQLLLRHSLPNDPRQDSFGVLGAIFCSQALTFGRTSLLLFPASDVVIDGDRSGNGANDENEHKQRICAACRLRRVQLRRWRSIRGFWRNSR